MDEVPLLAVEGLTLRRAGRDILYRLNLLIRAGEIHGLVGLNGSGKSSLAYALMGCAGYEADEGRIQFGGQDITHVSMTERARRGLTLAWQEPARFEGLAVGSYLHIGARDAPSGELGAALEAVALAPAAYLTRPVDRALSGGERKRIELASVFAMRPKLAILDEPDSGIDVLSLGDITALIRRMAAEGTAVLLITHRDEMVTVADSASLMCQGSIVFQGEASEVRGYFGRRCRHHAETMGAQPWPAPTAPAARSPARGNGSP